MAVAQSVATNQAAGTSGTQSSGGATPSLSNQSLPGNSNPGTARVREGRANAQNVRPNQSSTSAPGTEAGNASDNQAAPRDDSSSNPMKTSDTNTLPRGSTIRGLWIAVGLGIVLVITLIASALNRGRAANIGSTDSSSRARRDEIDRSQIRRVG